MTTAAGMTTFSYDVGDLPSFRTQTANVLRAAAVLRDLVEVPLALELFLADTMRFIPVQFSEPDPAI